ncbi:MAG: MbcA/ParS/Xre antitoxin family protein [Patescibacteria group bacterium]
MRAVLEVDAKILGQILEVPNLGCRKILDPQNLKLSEITVEKLFALQETLEYAEDVFDDKKTAALWFHATLIALGGNSPLYFISTPGVEGLKRLTAVRELLGQIRYSLYC